MPLGFPRAGALLLVLAVALAGCTTEAPAVEPPAGELQALTTPAPGDAEPGPNGTGLPAAYPGARPVFEDLWFNGTFQGHQAGWPKVLVTDTAGVAPDSLQLHDLSQYVPRGVPVLIVAEVNASLQEGDLDLWVNAPFEEFYNWEGDMPRGGYSRVAVTMVHASSDPVEVAVWYDEVEPAASFDYALHVTIVSDPSILWSGVPVGIELPAGALELGFMGAAEERAFLLWDPQDDFVGRFNASGEGPVRVDLGEERPAGEYVLMLAGGSGHAMVRVPGAAEAAMRVLRQDIREGAPQVFAGHSEAAWTFQVQRVPLQVGFQVRGSTVNLNFQAALSSPEGPLIEATFEGGPWIQPGFGFFTAMGQQGLVPGAYEVRAAFEVAAGADPVQGFETVVYYAR